MTWLAGNWQYVLFIVLWIWNEILAANPSLKSNSIVQLVVNLIMGLGPKPPTLPPSA